jgi:transposase-like protein
MPRKPRRFGRETKLAAVRRMLAGESVGALSRELNVLRKDLYKWRASFLSGGPTALRGPGRPRREATMDSGAVNLGLQRAQITEAQRRISELEEKLVRQEEELKAIRQALRAPAESRTGGKPDPKTPH